MKGIVVRAFDEKGFGFIKAEDGKEYFFHRSETGGNFERIVMWTERGLKVRVTFEIVPSQKGPRASNVSLSEDYDSTE
jgi:cold shock CspA family protein